MLMIHEVFDNYICLFNIYIYLYIFIYLKKKKKTFAEVCLEKYVLIFKINQKLKLNEEFGFVKK